MLLHVLTFQFGGFFGGDLGAILASWEQAGVFSYLLPFLLIFALVFGILSKIKVFGENRGLNAVIALVVGLLALQFQLVSVFFSDIFPRVGVALSIILALMILAGLFLDPESKFTNYLLMGAGIITFLFVLFQTAGDFGSFSFYWLYANLGDILIGVFVIVVFAIVVNSGKPRKPLPDMKVMAFRQ